MKEDKRYKWTNEEIKFLRNNLKNHTRNEIVTILNKTVSSVSNMMNRLGLKSIKIKRKGYVRTHKHKELQAQMKRGELNPMYGIKSPNWKHGKTKEYELIRHSPQYKEWRLKIYIRDNFTCQSCGQIGKNLNAHHLKSFVDFPNLRFEINNGITLCKECHQKTEDYLKNGNKYRWNK